MSRTSHALVSMFRISPLPSVRVSVSTTPLIVTFPVLVTRIVYSITSVAPTKPSSSPTIVAVLITVSFGSCVIVVIVGSSPVSVGPLSPSSEISLTVLPSGATPVAVAVLVSPPASTIA